VNFTSSGKWGYHRAAAGEAPGKAWNPSRVLARPLTRAPPGRDLFSDCLARARDVRGSTQVDQANNIALLELYLALFLGLLFRLNVVSDDAAEGALFDAVAALLGVFIFVYPVVRRSRWSHSVPREWVKERRRVG
jgi:hypothetical protein